MENLTVYYSVSNGGDGSAYPQFMESLELCEWDQDHMSEGWGESCTGSISFQSESPIFCLDKVVTKESYIIESVGENDMEEFIEQFFPDGLPTFTVKTEPTNNTNYLYNLIYVGDKQVGKLFLPATKSGDVLEKELNTKLGN